jgi:transketolase
MDSSHHHGFREASRAIAARVRQNVLRLSKKANVGHIGCGLCVADILTVVYSHMRLAGVPQNDRDRFVLSKGHAALALYCVLHEVGLLSGADLDTFHGDDSLLGVHPEWELPGVDFSTGSLGQGVCYAVGAALAGKMQRSQRRIYCLLSDAECNEGSVWEAAMFAAHHGLDNLTFIIDLNGQQALGFTKEVCRIDNMKERWEAFGWKAVEVDGHDCDLLTKELLAAASQDGKPHLIVAETVFGKGVSFMESKIEWHYLPMSDEQFSQALEEVGQ